jgi:glycosyltransferase involved in cell wall biosynthesis
MTTTDDTHRPTRDPGPPDLSLIVPVYNERDCVREVLLEAAGVLGGLGRTFEILAVNDGSTDDTRDVLLNLRREIPELRVFTLTPNCGQSAALGAGFERARGGIFLLMDADGQNDPASIPALLEGLRDHDLCCGFRASRRDAWSKRFGSRVANAVRRAALGDTIVDTGCTLKAIRREAILGFTMWRGMHRFLPVLAAMRGARIAQVPVNHRPRQAGASKYTNWGRLRETLWDLWAVRWMQRRYRRFQVEADA